MLRIIILILTAITLIVTGYFMTVSVALPTPTFKKALTDAGESSSEEMAKNVKIISNAVIDTEHPFTDHEFYGVDTDGTIFKINYTGQDPLEQLNNGQAIDIIGHVHGGAEPYVHAKQIIVNNR